MKSNAKPLSPGRRLRYRCEAGLAHFVAWLIPHFSRAAVMGLGRGLGWLMFHLDRRSRQLALANLDTAFRDTKTAAEKRRIAAASMKNFCATTLGLFWSPRLDRDAVRQLVQLDPRDVERVRAVAARGKGIIFQTLHFGDWELLSHTAAFCDIPMTVVMDNMRNPALEALLIRLRSCTGHTVITEHNAALKLLKTLKRAGTIALLIDLNAPLDRGGVWLDFFGLPVFNNSAVAALALHTGAPIICSVAVPLPGGRVRVEYGPEIEFTPTGHNDADLRALSQKCLDFCEHTVRRQPEFWLWSYKRWKNSPTRDLTGFPFYTQPVRVAPGQPTYSAAKK